MLLVLWAIVISGSFLFKKSKVYTLLLVVFGVLLFTFSYDNADSLNYLASYNNLKSGKTPVFSGNILSNLVFYFAGLFNSFKLSRFIFSFISFILIYTGGRRYTDNINIVLGLFLIAPYVINATQLKSMISMAVWFYFSFNLFEAYRGHSRLKNIFLYLLGVVIATLFHFSYALAVLYIFVIYFDKKKLGIIALIINAIGFTTLGLTRINYILDIISRVIPNFESALNRLRTITILSADYNYSFRIRTTIIFYIILLVCYLILRRTAKNSKQGNVGNSNNILGSEMAQFVFRLNIVSVMCFPLITISMEIYRIQRDLLLIDYAFLATLLVSSNTPRRYGIIHLKFSNLKVIFLGLITSGYYLFFEAVYGNIDSVFLPLFRLVR